MTKRNYQPAINAETKELVETALKGMMEHPKNNELIDSYRKAKREMAEAEARHAVDELVKEYVALEEYKKWLAAELKKDERRTKKRVPSSDLEACAAVHHSVEKFVACSHPNSNTL